MEAFKMILVMCMCILITTIICFFMRPEPCTHLDPGPELVLLSDYVESQEAVIGCMHTLKDLALTHTHPVPKCMHIDAGNYSIQKAQQKNNEASLTAIEALGDSIVANREAIETHAGFLQQITDGMVKLAVMINEVAEVK